METLCALLQYWRFCLQYCTTEDIVFSATELDKWYAVLKYWRYFVQLCSTRDVVHSAEVLETLCAALQYRAGDIVCNNAVLVICVQ